MENKLTTAGLFHPLSCEHREGMLFAERISKIPRQVSLDRVRDYTCWYWMKHIRPHFFHEERILLSYLPCEHPLAKRLLDEHAEIRDLILSLDYEPERHTFTVLSRLLKSHILFEEEKLFPWFDNNLGIDQRNSIETAISARPLEQCSWDDEWWMV